MKILFTNAGRRTYLIDFALELARREGDLEIHVSDCTSLAAAMHVSPEVRTHLTPPASAGEASYVAALLNLVEGQGIDLIVPLSDLDPPLLAGYRQKFQERGAFSLISSPEIVANCSDKRRTYEFCRANGLPTPDSWFDAAEYAGSFPAIQKHILGSGSSGLHRVESRDELSVGFVLGRDMLQPLIDGEEFGIDILNDLDGGFVACCVKRKLLMRSGETDKAQVVEDAELEALARRISTAFGHIGNLDCDVLRSRDGNLNCIDFNPRFGGGYPATHLAGLNFLAAIVDMVRGRPPQFPARPRPITVMKGISLHWCDTP